MDTKPEYPEDLERLLQEKLRDFAPEAPERLWSRIETALPARARRPVLGWVMGFVGLAVLSSLFYHNQQKKTVSFTPQNDMKVAEENKDVVGGTHAAHRQQPGIRPYPELSKSPVRNRPELMLHKGQKNSSIFPGGKNISIDNQALALSFPLNLAASMQPLTASASLPAHYLLPLPTATAHSLLPPAYDSRLLSMPLPLSRPPAYAEASAGKPAGTWRFAAGFEAAPVWIWQTTMPGDPHHGGQAGFAEHQQGPAIGWQAGVSVGYQVAPRWRMATGLSQRQTTQVSSHAATLRLIDGVCLNPYDSGPKEYEFHYALHSGGSESNVTVRIAQVDSISAMPADEPFLLFMRTTRHSTDWVLPLTIEHTFGRNRWQGFVQGGGQLSLPVRTQVQVDHFTEECIDLCFSGGRIPTLTAVERGKASVSWQFGAGLEYRIGSHWGLSVAPTFFGRKGQTGLSLNTGFNYAFGKM